MRRQVRGAPSPVTSTTRLPNTCQKCSPDTPFQRARTCTVTACCSQAALLDLWIERRSLRDPFVHVYRTNFLVKNPHVLCEEEH